MLIRILNNTLAIKNNSEIIKVIESRNAQMRMLSIYVIAFTLLLGIFNIMLGEVLHQKVHHTGGQLAKQVYDLKLDVITERDVIAALAENHGFMLEPGEAPLHFSAFMAEESEVFSYKSVSLKLYHWPSWIVESYLFILLNLILIGVAVWSYRWWCVLFKNKLKAISSASQSDLPLTEARTVEDKIAGSDIDKSSQEHKQLPPENALTTLYAIQNNYNHLFALFYCGQPFPHNIDLENHFKLVIVKGFKELSKISVKLLPSGGLAITLENISQTDIDNYMKRLHQIIFQTALVYRGDLSRKDVKVGVCNYRDGADQTIVYQLTKSALVQAKQSVWQHIQRIPFNYTRSIELAEGEDKLPDYITKKKFMLFFQPLFDLATGEMLQHEALIRIRHKSLGMLSARQFIPQLTNETAIVQLDQAVVEQVIKLLEAEPSSLTVSINVHSLNWFSRQFWLWFDKKMRSFKGSNKLQFEILEDDFYQHLPKLTSALNAIKAISGTVLIDNVTTSNKIGLLEPYKIVKGLKLGFELIHNIDSNLKQQKAVRQIVLQSTRINLPVYGVGVETQLELNTLKKLGVVAAQGFYFTEPLQEFNQVTSN